MKSEILNIRGHNSLFVEKTDWFSTAAELLEDSYTMCVDLCAVDYMKNSHPDLPEDVTPMRFEIVASFLSHQKKSRIKARCQVSLEDPTIDSLYQLYPGVDFHEREAFDMFGIIFNNHPDLSRILMPETWEGHPLRKDFAIGSVPVQFKESGADS